jgi:hypothetical protein
MGNGAMVMGDTVVFEDEVDTAMDAAFAHGLSVTALHNHFFHDTPKVYFMHIGGEDKAEALAAGVKSVWDAIRAVRAAQPSRQRASARKRRYRADRGRCDNQYRQPDLVIAGCGQDPMVAANDAWHRIGGSMGPDDWAAFSGGVRLAAMDGDFIMSAAEVQPVLHALRKGGIHIVALHSHMIGEQPNFYFTHFWSTGKTEDLARALRAALDAQARVDKP